MRRAWPRESLLSQTESYNVEQTGARRGVWPTRAVIIEMTANFETHEYKISVHCGKLLTFLKLFIILKKLLTHLVFVHVPCVCA